MNSSALAKTILADYKKQIDPLLVEFFQGQKAQIPTSLKYAHQMLNNLEDFCTRGGKRLRPALVYYGYKLLGGDESKDILKASLAMELIHTFLLIHDDIMDESDFRRGKTTMHKIYKAECETVYRANGNSQRFGETMGILAGDLSFCLAFELLLSSDFSPELKTQVMQKLQDTVTNTIFGQELDVRLEFNGSSKPSEILSVYKLKTAQYTFECPLHIGAMLAGATQKDLETISNFAIPGGIAFQIRDDILGMFGDKKHTGKPVGSDIKQGKQTLLIAKALQKAGKIDRKRIKAALGNKELDENGIRKIQSIIRKTGALAECERVAKKHIDQAKQALSKFSKHNWDKDIIKKLDNIADFIVERKV